MLQQHWWRALAACALILFAGCNYVGDDDVGSASEAIEIGTNDIETPSRNAVVRVQVGSNTTYCTGTLIGPDLVLTAARCGFNSLAHRAIANGEWQANPTGNVLVSFGSDRANPVRVITASHISLPPVPTGAQLFQPDMVLLRLREQVTTDIAIPRAVLFSTPSLTSTTRLFQVGFGGAQNRRFVGGQGYTTTGVGPNRFTYVVDHSAPGVGDSGTNLESEDYGGPLFHGSVDGPLLGVLSELAPATATLTFGNGGGGQPSVVNWLQPKVTTKVDYGWVITTGNSSSPPVVFRGPSGAPTVQVLTTVTRVTFPGAGHAWPVVPMVHARVSGNGNFQCAPVSATPVGNALQIDVRCNTSSQAVPFVLSWIRQHDASTPGVAYVGTTGTTSLGATVLYSWNSSGEGVDVGRVSTGVYDVTLFGQTSPLQSVAHATSAGMFGHRCKIASWSNQADKVVRVVCHNAQGLPVDSDFNMLFTATRTPHGGPGGHAWLDRTTLGVYTPSIFFQYNTQPGRVTTDNYVGNSHIQSVLFPAQTGSGIPIVTARGTDASYCFSTYQSHFGILVRCRAPNGQSTFSQATVSYLMP